MDGKDEIKRLLHDVQVGLTGDDITHAVVRGTVQAVPLIGGLAAEFYGLVIVPPLEKRRGELLTLIAEDVIRIGEQVSGFNYENLKDNEAFVSAVATAIPIGMRTHIREKHEALRNAVVNVALGYNPNETLDLVFLNIIDETGPEHWRILEWCAQPLEYAQRKGVPNAEKHTYISTGYHNYDLFDLCFPELHDEEAFVKKIFSDLEAHGFIHGDWPNSVDIYLSKSGRIDAWVTGIGGKFLELIKSPAATATAVERADQR